MRKKKSHTAREFQCKKNGKRRKRQRKFMEFYSCKHIIIAVDDNFIKLHRAALACLCARCNSKVLNTIFALPFAMDLILRCSNSICSVHASLWYPPVNSMPFDSFRNLRLNHVQDHHRINYLREQLTLSILYLHRFSQAFVFLFMDS